MLAKVENYTTAIPDSVTESVLNSAGLQSSDVQVEVLLSIKANFYFRQVTRMVSLVAQKFLSDVAYEALQHCKMRGGGKEMKKVIYNNLSTCSSLKLTEYFLGVWTRQKVCVDK